MKLRKKKNSPAWNSRLVPKVGAIGNIHIWKKSSVLQRRVI